MKVIITHFDESEIVRENVSAFYPCRDLTTNSFMFVNNNGVDRVSEVKEFFIEG